MKMGIAVALVLAAIIVAYSSIFMVNQTQQALVVRLGDPVRIVSEPGINIKVPFIDSVIAIDPTQRGLGLDEQVRRSRQLVQMTIKSAHKCLDVEAPPVAAALDSVARSLVAPSGAVTRSQAIDENISLAGALWRMREGKCTARPEDEALALVQDRIAQ